MKEKKNDLEVVAETEKDSREITTEFPTVKEDETRPAKKRSGLFRHERKKQASKPLKTIDSEADMRVAEETDPTSLPVVEVDIGDTQEINTDSPTRPIPNLNDTRVLEDGEEEDAILADKGSQMLLEGFEEETPSKSEQGDEERLRRVRREKIEDFSQKREQHMQQVAESEGEPTERGEVIYPETPLENESVEETETGSEPIEDNIDVVATLTAASHSAGARLFFSVVLEIILCLMTVFAAITPSVAMNPTVYLTIQVALFAALCALNMPLLGEGLSALFIGKATIASGVAASSIATLVHTALQYLHAAGVTDGSVPLFTGVAGFGILLLAVAKRVEKDRQLKIAAFVIGDDSERLVYKRITDPTLAEEIGRPACAIGEPRVAYYRRTAKLDNYLTVSDDSRVCAKPMKWYMPIVIGVSLLIALIYFALNGISSWMTTATVFCAMLTVAAPAVLFFSLQMAISGASHTAEEEGTLFAGYSSAEELGNVHALALDAMDIFPEQSVLLHGIKTFSGTRIDDAILDAASVSVRAGGPLSHVFRRMIQNKVDMLREVDTLVYEQDMGLSGWVSGRRVLIGNRKLLDNHGIDIPSRDYEQRYAINGRQLVYLSIAGELSAMFVVSYIADPTVKTMLTRLTKERITLLIRTCDQNITERLVADVFELNGYYVELLNAPAGRSFEGLVDGVSESETVSVVAQNSTNGMILALALCSRLRIATRFFAILQGVVGFIGILLVGYTALFGGIVFPPLYILEFLLIASVIFGFLAIFFGKK